MAWLSDWAKRVKLTIDQADIDAALSNFPILVHLGTSVGRNSDDVSFVFDELESDANRKKIAVTTSDGQTQCYVEIEKWDDANEQAWLWVKVPSVASGADTDLYLYYDKTKADNTAYVGDPSDAVVHNVWDSNFKLVTHMRDDPDTSHVRDSTGNNNDGTKKGAGEPVVTTAGKIADAQSFDALDDYITLPNIYTYPMTLSGWVKPDTITGEQFHFLYGSEGSGDGFGGTSEAHLSINWGYWGIFCKTKGVQHFSTNQGVVVQGEWQRATLVIAAICRLYQNGVEIWSDTIAGVPDFGNYVHHFIGRPSNGIRFLDGMADEIRISDIERTPAWIKASHESERDDLLDFGSEEEPVTEKTSSDTGEGAEASSQVATLTRSETGSGQDTRLSFLAALTKSDVGSGVDARLAFLAELAKSESGSGADAILSLLAEIIKTDGGSGAEVSNLIIEALAILSSESGIGIEATISRLLAAAESGSAEERASRAGWLMKPSIYTKDAFEQITYTGE